MNGMDAVRKLILQRIDELGSNLAEASRAMGKSHSYLQQFISRGVPKKLDEDNRVALAAFLKVPLDQLKSSNGVFKSRATGDALMLENEHNRNGNADQKHAVLVPGSGLVGATDLPVYGTAQGGRGSLVVTNEAIDWVMRPEPLFRVKDGYGVIVTGDSMSPEHREGSTALVNPHIPPRAGDTCIFRQHSDDGTVHAVIKELRRFNDDFWYVKQYSPPKEFTLKRSEWQICHVTVGNYRRR